MVSLVMFMLEIVILANDLLSPIISEEQDDSIVTEIYGHKKLLKERTKLLQQFGMDLLPVLIEICVYLDGPGDRKCLSVISKLMHFSSACMIKSLLSVTNISSFLAGVLAWKDPNVLTSALQIADILMNKLPEVFSKLFVREGVIQAVNTLVILGSPGSKHSDIAVGSSPSSLEVPTSVSRLCVDVDARSKDLLYLKHLCLKLTAFDNLNTKSEGDDIATSIVSDILTAISKEDAIYTYEFVESGVVEAFLSYLSCGFYSKENISESAISIYHEQATRRCKSFIAIALPSGLQDKEVAPMSILIKMLQNALSFLESFPVFLGFGAGSFAARPKIKVRLCRSQGEESLIDFSSNVLLINIFTTLAAVEKFLWPQVQQNESIQPLASAGESETGIIPTGAREELTRDNFFTSSKEKGKAILVLKDESGTRMRNDARTRAAVDKGAQMKTDEELDVDISDNKELDVDISDDEDQDDVSGGFRTTPRLIFFADEKQLSRNMSIYQVIQQLLLDVAVNDKYNDEVGEVGAIYTITYQRANTPTNKVLVETISSVSSVDSLKWKMPLVDSILRRQLPCDLEKTNPTYNILALLRVLEGLNKPCLHLGGKMSSLYGSSETDGVVPGEKFINNQINSKLAIQIEDRLSIRTESLPSWCCQLIKACPFLFPFKTRRQYFYVTVFGCSRALFHLQQQKGVDGIGSTSRKGLTIGKLHYLRFCLSRDSILDSAAKVMKMDSKYVLEVGFLDENDPWDDPGRDRILEFYALIIRELQKVGCDMWRINNASDKSMMEVEGKGSEGDIGLVFDDLIQAPLGLFPCSWPTDAYLSDGSRLKKVAGYFKLLGRVLAKALKDKRPLDLPLSPAFYKLLLGQDLNLHDIISFDPQLGGNLLRYQALVDGKWTLGSRGANNQVIEIQPCENENTNKDPSNDFTLPGYSYHENVCIDNLEEYIFFVLDVTCGSGIRRQLEALRSGFNKVFNISSLQIFSAKELEYMLCNKE